MNSERETSVHTADLLETLRANRDQHVMEYKQAVEGYLEKAKSLLSEEFGRAKVKLNESYTRAKSELELFDPEKAEDTIVFCRSIQFTLKAPRDHSDAYDQAIKMMNWESRETVMLTTTEFRCFVMNNWDWTDEFQAISGMYRK